MPVFSRASFQKKLTCDKRLQNILDKLIKEIDITVICGYRGEKEQNEAVANGNSKTPWPTSRHNADPSLAVDIAVYHPDEPHIHWDDINEFVALSKIVKRIAKEQGIKIEYGGDWQSIKDYDHYQVDPIED